MPLRRIDVGGVRVSYAEAGSGEPVLLLHGYPQDHLCWRHQFDALAKTHRVIAPDWFGWGESERSTAIVPEYDAEVERLGALAAALRLERFSLAGHDYGAFLGLGYVIAHPRQVRRLALLNSRAHRSFTSRFYRRTAMQCFLSREPLLRWILAAMPIASEHRRVMQRYVDLGCFDAALVERYVGWMDTRAGRKWFSHFFAHYDVRPRRALQQGLRTISCPTAVIWGARDPFCAETIARELARDIPCAKLTLLDDADHFVMEQCPDAVTQAMSAWLMTPAQ